jgi:hypothetical protein
VVPEYCGLETTDVASGTFVWLKKSLFEIVGAELPSVVIPMVLVRNWQLVMVGEALLHHTAPR